VSGDAATRTGLAWQRLSLAYFVVGLAMINGLGHAGIRSHPVAGAVVLGLGAMIAAAGAWWARRRTQDGKGPAHLASSHDVTVIAAASVIVGIASIIIVIAEI
jgi:uncharacterized membrane protein YidH (DUF202 family)